MTGSLILLGFLQAAKAQQKPQYTQYLINQFIINPAITGIENYTDLKLSYRHQWVGILDGPVTSYFTAHTPIGKEDLRSTATSFVTDRERNPIGPDYWNEYEAPAPHHGIGIQIINDATGPINRFSGYLTYAYHLGLSSKTSLSAGIGLGVNNTSLNADELEFGDITVDPAVYGSGQLNNLRPDMMAGLYLYSDRMFAGISAQQLVPQSIDFSNGIVKQLEGKQVPHFFGTFGYRLGAGQDFNLVPSVLIKYVNPTPVQVDLNAKLQYRDIFWMGAGIRFNDGFMGMAGVNVGGKLHLSYSYDYSTSELNNFSKGTHEVVVGFVISKRGDTCPRSIW